MPSFAMFSKAHNKKKLCSGRARFVNEPGSSLGAMVSEMLAGSLG